MRIGPWWLGSFVCAVVISGATPLLVQALLARELPLPWRLIISFGACGVWVYATGAVCTRLDSRWVFRRGIRATLNNSADNEDVYHEMCTALEVLSDRMKYPHDRDVLHSELSRFISENTHTNECLSPDAYCTCGYTKTIQLLEEWDTPYPEEQQDD